MNDRASKLTRAESGTSASRQALACDLEELRRSVIRHLDSLESMALEGRVMPVIEPDWGDPGASRDERLSARLENDRLLLAAAWERLERERLEAGAPKQGGSSLAPPRAVRPAEPAPTAADGCAPRAATQDTVGNPVAETILRQFQTLCSDVRRTTDARLSSR